jgi:hypothetical protein
MMSSIHSTTEQSTMLPCNPLADKPKKSVSFSESARMKKHIHINDFTQEEIDACWFTESELSQSRQEISYTIDLMTRGEDIDASKYCTRGLECRTPQGAAIKVQTKIDAWDSVMDEQDRQFSLGINDVDSLSMVYIQSSWSCQVSAAAMACLDARSSSSHAQSRKREMPIRQYQVRRTSIRC